MGIAFIKEEARRHRRCKGCLGDIEKGETVIALAGHNRGKPVSGSLCLCCIKSVADGGDMKMVSECEKEGSDV